MNAATTTNPMAPAAVAPQNLAVSDYSESIRYYGTRDQLVAAALVGAEQSFVAQPGKHGVRFVNQQGQRVVISKWKTPGTFCLCIHRTQAQREARRREHAAAQRLAEIDEALRWHDVPQAAYRQEVRDLLGGCMWALWQRMFTYTKGGSPNDAHVGAWSFGKEAEGAMREHWEALRKVIEHVPLTRDDARGAALRKERAALTDGEFQRFLGAAVSRAGVEA